MEKNNTALVITREDKAILERLVRSGRTEQRVALRARIILSAAAGKSNLTTPHFLEVPGLRPAERL